MRIGLSGVFSMIDADLACNAAAHIPKGVAAILLALTLLQQAFINVKSSIPVRRPGSWSSGIHGLQNDLHTLFRIPIQSYYGRIISL